MVDKLLTKPFSYDKEDNLNVNLNNGSMTYHETDLSLPGKNGLDLNIVRMFDSDEAATIEPFAEVIYPVDPQRNANAFEAGYDVYDNRDGKLLDRSQYRYSAPEISTQSIYKVIDFDVVAAWYEENTTMYSLAYPIGGGSSIVIKAVPYAKSIAYYASPDRRSTEAGYFYHYKENDRWVNEFGLGHGWCFGFSSIEDFHGGFGADYPMKRLILSDGRKYLLGPMDSQTSTYKLYGYDLEDIKLTSNAGQYILTHKDGKKEYFDYNGRNTRIEDRYGNAIRLEYTTVNNGEVVNQIRITDSLNNVIIIKNDNIPSNTYSYFDNKTYQKYNYKWSLSLNGEVIKQYYSLVDNYTLSSDYTSLLSRHARMLCWVKNQNNEDTAYTTYPHTARFNMFANKETPYDIVQNHPLLQYVRYPNGQKLSLGYNAYWQKPTMIKRKIGYGTGYQEFPTIISSSYTIVAKGNNIDEDDRQAKQYTYGDVNDWACESRDYQTKVEEFYFARPVDSTYYCRVQKRDWTYTFNRNHEMKSEAQNSWTSLQEGNKTRADIDAHWNTYKSTKTYQKEYSYNTNHLPTQIKSTEYLSDGTTVGMNRIWNYTNNKKNVEVKAVGIKDAAGNLVAGSPGYPAGVIATKTEYNNRY